MIKVRHLSIDTAPFALRLNTRNGCLKVIIETKCGFAFYTNLSFWMLINVTMNLH